MTAIAAPAFEPLDADACKQHLALVKSMHCCRPVVINGLEQHIQVVHARQAGGRIEMDVWITGSAERVDPALITFPKMKD